MFEKHVHAAPSTSGFNQRIGIIHDLIEFLIEKKITWPTNPQKSVLKCFKVDDEINQGLKWVSDIGLG